MNDKRLRVLLIEDNPGDARLVREMLNEVKNSRLCLEWKNSLAEGISFVEGGGVDVILLDLSLPDSHGHETFSRMHAVAAEIPILVMSGLSDENIAVQTVREGAQDYLLKGQVDGASIYRAIRYALERKEAEIERMGLIRELQDALTKIRTLQGLLPICASCKRIRDDKGYWNQIELYISEHSDAVFTHGICPDCVEKLYPDFARKE
jgi:DNA-binding NarL/FixJ family response regulator